MHESLVHHKEEVGQVLPPHRICVESHQSLGVEGGPAEEESHLRRSSKRISPNVIEKEEEMRDFLFIQQRPPTSE